MRIIVCGLIAQYPLGGVAWDYLQYVVGLHRLGHDVYYFEDTGNWPFNPAEDGVSKGCEFNVSYLSRLMERFGLGDRWAYRFPYQDQWFGMAQSLRHEIVESADLLFNVSGCLEYPNQYRRSAKLIYIDSDPVFTQLKILKGNGSMVRNLRQHDVHFSFGEAISNGTSNLPPTEFEWHPTRQPILLDEWARSPERFGYTTVMNWTSYKDIEHEGVIYGQKDEQFEAFISLPSAIPELAFQIALNEGKTRRSPKVRLRGQGWDVLDPSDVCADLDSYRDFLASSRGEWSVAKGGYVTGRSGWFSCRSACYLAAGRPVVVQSTGFEDFVPTGNGVLTFTDFNGARDAIKRMEMDYEAHSEAARHVAETHFASDRVLSEMLERCDAAA
ncbi:glycosyltransferase [Tateyamaria pelophila]|uniref:glycosyltransferase n=1 Tax=Tateyamaria pelophila TaxID=328415 RepID=UPI001CBAA3BD|nr:glycosyltransferase [Tateyamaria pelophila]